MSASALPSFDRLLDLARNSPEELERLRLEMTNQILDSTPDQGVRLRLEQLAFRIDAERRRGRTPLSLCLHYSNLMHRQLGVLNQELHKLLQPVVLPCQTGDNQPARPSAKIIPFSRYQKPA
ncbi:DUF3135 domain-containing protein [Marinospirillum sp.]|uniref:DUF3135 domain-containing protein n=1 Tax=Marinospirillum sp. TaxID=2183934 RepID=UPI00384FF0C6